MYLQSKTAALTHLPAASREQVRPVSQGWQWLCSEGEQRIVPQRQSLEVQEK
jgi:hypothetical protein